MARLASALLVGVSIVAAAGADVASAQAPLVARMIERFEREAARQSGLLPRTLRDLAGHGTEARAASPTIASLMESDDPEIRIAAVRALGYIGHDDAGLLVPKLVPFLDDVDVRMAWAAAETLGALRDPGAVDELAEIAASHWYPPTRVAAAQAIRYITDGAAYRDPEQDWFSAYLELGRSLPSCGQRYDAARYGGAEIAVDDGRLVWSNRGEFGGELSHVNRGGVERVVLEDNVIDVYALNQSHVIVAGLAHMGLNHGRLYLLERQGAELVARVWRELPGTPYASTLTDSRELLVHTYGGSLVVSANGDMRMADCSTAAEQ